MIALQHQRMGVNSDISAEITANDDDELLSVFGTSPTLQFKGLQSVRNDHPLTIM